MSVKFCVERMRIFRLVKTFFPLAGIIISFILVTKEWHLQTESRHTVEHILLRNSTRTVEWKTTLVPISPQPKIDVTKHTTWAQKLSNYDPQKDQTIVIIGAGPTGLGAAYRLLELGILDTNTQVRA